MSRFGFLVIVFVMGACDQGEPRTLSAEHRAAEQAVKDAEKAKKELETVMKELDHLDAEVSAAIDAVANAKTDAERASAKAKLTVIQRKQHEMKQRTMEQRLRDHRDRRGMPTNKECLDNPRAKGCSSTIPS